jgi:cell division protein FtsB
MTASAHSERVPGGRWRIRWSRLILGLVAIDMAITVGVSGLQFLRLRHQEAALAQHIQAVNAQSAVLQREVRDLHNPATLKNILTGKEKLANPLWPN